MANKTKPLKFNYGTDVGLGGMQPYNGFVEHRKAALPRSNSIGTAAAVEKVGDIEARLARLLVSVGWIRRCRLRAPSDAQLS
jgi:hypothetical protein